MGGLGTAAESISSLFSEQTLTAYTSLYTEPREAISGIVERLVEDAVRKGLEAEAVLLLGVAIWRLRRYLVPPWILTRVTPLRAAAVYLTVVALMVGSILVPQKPEGPRYPVAIAQTAAVLPRSVDSCCWPMSGPRDRGHQAAQLPPATSGEDLYRRRRAEPVGPA